MNLHYEIHGSGKPLILIPGFASGAWNWFRQVDDLAKNFQVITFDPRGIGKSKTKNISDLMSLSMRVFTEDVRQILDEAEFEKVNVIGASFGGFVAQEFALDFPERLEKLILVCTSAGGVKHIRPSDEVLKSFAPDLNMSAGARIRKFILPAFTNEFQKNYADEIERVCRMRESTEVADAVYMAQLQTAFMFDSNTRLGEIKSETLVITGDKDVVVPPENSHNLAEKLPNVKLEIIENSGHLVFVEQAEKFNEIVTDFLKS